MKEDYYDLSAFMDKLHKNNPLMFSKDIITKQTMLQEYMVLVTYNRIELAMQRNIQTKNTLEGLIAFTSCRAKKAGIQEEKVTHMNGD